MWNKIKKMNHTFENFLLFQLNKLSCTKHWRCDFVLCKILWNSLVHFRRVQLYQFLPYNFWKPQMKSHLDYISSRCNIFQQRVCNPSKDSWKFITSISCYLFALFRTFIEFINHRIRFLEEHFLNIIGLKKLFWLKMHNSACIIQEMVSISVD